MTNRSEERRVGKECRAGMRAEDERRKGVGIREQGIISIYLLYLVFFFFSSRRRHTRLQGDWSSDVCSSDLYSVGRDGKQERAFTLRFLLHLLLDFNAGSYVQVAR